MKILKWMYERTHNEPAPYYYDYSLGTILVKPLRKWLTNVVAYNCPFNFLRIFIYKLCGFKIGRGTFIGMHCYLDDMKYDQMRIGNYCKISYGVYFAAHGRNQKAQMIIVDDYAYIGMRASIISKNCKKDSCGVRIGKNAVIGACTLVNRDVPDGMTAVGVPCRIINKGEEEIE